MIDESLNKEDQDAELIRDVYGSRLKILQADPEDQEYLAYPP